MTPINQLVNEKDAMRIKKAFNSTQLEPVSVC
jgi:hypothetical protein